MAVYLSPSAREALARIERPVDRAPIDKGEKAEGGFGDILSDALGQAEAADKDAEVAAQKFAAGEMGIHETIMAQERAGIAVRYAVTLKNKALEAYREIMNTQV